MSTYIVTGGTGFLGRSVVQLLLQRDESCAVHVLVRSSSLNRFERAQLQWVGGDRVHALVGDLDEADLGLRGEDVPDGVEHIVHLGATYDLTAGKEQATTNVGGTRSVIALAKQTGALLHHVSSIAVAGDHRGTFSETDFEVGQAFPTPYHRTKFESEKLVRDTGDTPWRIYRPAAVVGDSRTGAIDKIDGPYYFFPFFAGVAKLPSALPLVVPKIGATNLVPVDYVAAALVELMHQPGTNGRVFHLVNSEPQPIREVFGAFAHAAGARNVCADIPGSVARPFMSPHSPVVRTARDAVIRSMGIPQVMLENLTLPTTFTSTQTQAALSASGLTPPPLGQYADILWAYWSAELDPNRARTPDPRGPLFGRVIVITGASSGIGKAASMAAARHGAIVVMLARSADALEAVATEITDAGGSAYAYPCDITDTESVDHTIKTILAEHDHVDMLVNNAGRSIRRSVYRSTDRLHDFERTMAVNYFGAVRLTLAVLPIMRERRFGHIVNVSTAGVQAASPRFAAYVGSKSALDGFADVAAAETLSDGITFTTIHMPLVDTPMITPTGSSNAGPVISAEKAGAIVIRALVERPKRIDTPLGTLGEFGALFFPRSKDRVMHLFYRSFPDSAAAKGEISIPAATPAIPPKRAVPATRVLTKAVGRLGRLIPGTFW